MFKIAIQEVSLKHFHELVHFLYFTSFYFSPLFYGGFNWSKNSIFILV
jgi:hypothetical protein